MFPAENECGEGITERERGVRYWNDQVSHPARGPFGPKTTKNWKMLKKLPLCGLYRHKKMKFWVVQKFVKIEAAELRSRRDRDRLKGNDETESLRPPELAGNRQKIENYYYNWFFSYLFPPKNITNNSEFPNRAPYYTTWPTGRPEMEQVLRDPLRNFSSIFPTFFPQKILLIGYP